MRHSVLVALPVISVVDLFVMNALLLQRYGGMLTNDTFVRAFAVVVLDFCWSSYSSESGGSTGYLPPLQSFPFTIVFGRPSNSTGNTCLRIASSSDALLGHGAKTPASKE